MAIIDALTRYTATTDKYPDGWLPWSRICQNRDWYKKFGTNLLSRTKESLIKAGMIGEQVVKDENDEKAKPRKTGNVRLRQT
jgi:hypothetical protein